MMPGEALTLKECVVITHVAKDLVLGLRTMLQLEKYQWEDTEEIETLFLEAPPPVLENAERRWAAELSYEQGNQIRMEMARLRVHGGMTRMEAYSAVRPMIRSLLKEEDLERADEDEWQANTIDEAWDDQEELRRRIEEFDREIDEHREWVRRNRKHCRCAMCWGL